MSNERIAEIREIIDNFAREGQYSVNNPYVKALYRELRELESRPQVEDDDDYEEIFIGGSDVPVSGRYE